MLKRGLDAQRGKVIFRVTQWAFLWGVCSRSQGLYPQPRPLTKVSTAHRAKVVESAGFGFRGGCGRCVSPGQVAQSLQLCALTCLPAPYPSQCRCCVFLLLLGLLPPETRLSVFRWQKQVPPSGGSPEEGQLLLHVERGALDGIPLILLGLGVGVRSVLSCLFLLIIRNDFLLSLCSVLCCWDL